MSSTIKIHFSDGRDWDTEIVLTPEQVVNVRDYLCKIRYGDVYKHCPSWATDGNTAGSKSDQETTATLAALYLLRSVFSKALPGHE